jgi:hypothetical protein
LAYAGLLADFQENMILFKGIRVIAPFRRDSPFVDKLGPGVTGSRGDICRLLLRQLRKLMDSDIVFNTRAEIIDPEKGDVRIGDSVHNFDLICGADGGESDVPVLFLKSITHKSVFAAGGRTRDSCGFQTIASGQHSNHSSMIALDLHLDELDPELLHIFGMHPCFQVAGAINGPPAGKTTPLWFCQLGTNGPLPSFRSPIDAMVWLQENCPFVAKHASDASVARFYGAKSVPSGRWKVVDTFVKVRILLVVLCCKYFHEQRGKLF